MQKEGRSRPWRVGAAPLPYLLLRVVSTPDRSALPHLRLPLGRRRQAQDDQKGIGIVSNHLVPAIDLPLGPWSQELDRIGANGIMVIRILMWSPAQSALAWLQRHKRQNRPKRP